jgi:hypothetical protein
MRRPFDWLDLFRRHNIEFVERGANVKRGEINIRCPWCGSADPSHHLGLNLENGWYACWRNRTHRGKSPIRLLMQLLGVPYGKARTMAGLDESYVDPDGFDAVAARIMGRDKTIERVEQVRREALRFDRDFVPITERIGTRKAWNYLYGRRFGTADDVDALCEDYQLMTARSGRQADRVIFPYYLDGKLVTWSGRAIGHSEIRYKDLPIDEALVPAKETLFNHDCILKGGHTLVLVEGPVDTLKIDHFGKRYGVRAVGLSTNSISEEQAFLLQAASDSFTQTVIMMDTKGVLGLVDSMRMKQQLAFLPRLRILPVPSGRGDAGELTKQESTTFAQTITAK